MSLANDLLEQARHLASREPTRPRQASLRRAASAAYYAVFHLLTSEAVAIIGANLSADRRALVQRCFNHADMRRVSQTFRSQNLLKPPTLAGLQPSAHLQSVADIFVRLQEARHRADYDVASVWTRFSTQQQIRLATEAFAAWALIRSSGEANLFILALLSWKSFEAER